MLATVQITRSLTMDTRIIYRSSNLALSERDVNPIVQLRTEPCRTETQTTLEVMPTIETKTWLDAPFSAPADENGERH
jgi:hypothetical protein